MTSALVLSQVRSRSLVIPLAFALALQALGGLLLPWLYRDVLLVATALRSSDITNLVVVVPMLIGLRVLTRRGHSLAQVASVGVVFYVWENNIYYLAGCAYNQLFLIYVTIAILSLFELIQALNGMDRRQIEESIARAVPRKVISLTTVAMAAILCVLWIGQSADYIVTGRLPQMLTDAGASTHLVAALDLSLLVPLYVLGAVLLWRRLAWGYIISAGTLVQGALVTIGLVITSPIQAAAGIQGAWSMFPLWSLMGICFLFAAILLFKNIAPNSTEKNMSKDTSGATGVSRKRIGYAVTLGLTFVLVVFALVTAMPLSASKPNILGYASCCSFAPWSTLSLLALAGVSCVVRKRSFKPAHQVLPPAAVRGMDNVSA